MGGQRGSYRRSVRQVHNPLDLLWTRGSSPRSARSSSGGASRRRRTGSGSPSPRSASRSGRSSSGSASSCSTAPGGASSRPRRGFGSTAARSGCSRSRSSSSPSRRRRGASCADARDRRLDRARRDGAAGRALRVPARATPAFTSRSPSPTRTRRRAGRAAGARARRRRRRRRQRGVGFETFFRDEVMLAVPAGHRSRADADAGGAPGRAAHPDAGGRRRPAGDRGRAPRRGRASPRPRRQLELGLQESVERRPRRLRGDLHLAVAGRGGARAGRLAVARVDGLEPGRESRSCARRADPDAGAQAFVAFARERLACRPLGSRRTARAVREAGAAAAARGEPALGLARSAGRGGGRWREVPSERVAMRRRARRRGVLALGGGGAITRQGDLGGDRAAARLGADDVRRAPSGRRTSASATRSGGCAGRCRRAPGGDRLRAGVDARPARARRRSVRR